jgi:hypothetical protein
LDYSLEEGCELTGWHTILILEQLSVCVSLNTLSAMETLATFARTRIPSLSKRLRFQRSTHAARNPGWSLQKAIAPINAMAIWRQLRSMHEGLLVTSLRKPGAPVWSALSSSATTMPKNLIRLHASNDFHFLTFICYQRRPHLSSVHARECFEQELEEVRKRYRFVVNGYGARSFADPMNPSWEN